MEFRFLCGDRLGIVATLRKLGLTLIAASCALVVASGVETSPTPGFSNNVAHASLASVRRMAVEPLLEREAPAVEVEVELASEDEVARQLAKLPAMPQFEVLARGVASLSPTIPEEELGEPVPSEPKANEPAPLDVVRWSVDRAMRVEQVATNWGMWIEDLRELNPELGDAAWVEAGRELVVFRKDLRRRTQSVGSPNRGHLVSGMPLPEGPHWLMREHRPRAFGSRTTIHALVEALQRYGEADASAPPVRIGEISRRTGGRIAPHVSHRSGRDVDMGYVMKSNPDPNERFWRTATPKTIDAPRTWAVIEALIATGQVQQIFISAKLQPAIAKAAAKTLSPEEVAKVFSAMNPDPKVATIVRHESGHRDHMHVRFGCEPGNVRCRTQSAKPR